MMFDNLQSRNRNRRRSSFYNNLEEEAQNRLLNISFDDTQENKYQVAIINSTRFDFMKKTGLVTHGSQQLTSKRNKPILHLNRQSKNISMQLPTESQKTNKFQLQTNLVCIVKRSRTVNLNNYLILDKKQQPCQYNSPNAHTKVKINLPQVKAGLFLQDDKKLLKNKPGSHRFKKNLK